MISAPGLFEGNRECAEFEYDKDGHNLRWKGQKEFVPVGSIGVVGNPEKVASEPVSQPASESELALKKQNAQLAERLKALEEQAARDHTARTQQRAQESSASELASKKRIAELEAQLAVAKTSTVENGGIGEGSGAPAKVPAVTTPTLSPEPKK